MAPSRTRQMVANGFSVSKIRRTTYHQIPNQSNYIRMKWNWFSCNAKKHGTQAASINKLLDSRKSWNHGVKRFSLFWAKSPTALLWEFLPHGSAFIIPLNNWNERWTNDLVIFGEEQRQRQHTDRVGHTAPGLRYPRGEEGSSVKRMKQKATATATTCACNVRRNTTTSKTNCLRYSFALHKWKVFNTFKVI